MLILLRLRDFDAMKERILLLVKFGIVGASATCIDAAFYVLCVFRFPMNLSKLFSMLASCTYSFVLHKKWTFGDDGSIKSEIPLYVFSQIVNILVNVKTNEMAYLLLNSRKYAFIIATCTAMAVNYMLQQFVVFRRGRI